MRASFALALRRARHSSEASSSRDTTTMSATTGSRQWPTFGMDEPRAYPTSVSPRLQTSQVRARTASVADVLRAVPPGSTPAGTVLSTVDYDTAIRSPVR
ncbi:hypothetical protein H340_23553 [Streptomyces mobaraensis NBRC 13819 = DSM 40847]|uniref:Uncharacterized protein n=1 Tax=Streptomyces mobaraensis (strain ATCC 29032 / DSM 40847 / JCM 4168 / NBRC 13819 / NCIMB 11159 / IPCR 16-22) TaxID=1223523 RepID=M2ZZ25_STRM1|nr:hypothetical protein H340_23553 [Streptomyces mobaraensis NBRC 13819 = DSM 40847]